MLPFSDPIEDAAKSDQPLDDRGSGAQWVAVGSPIETCSGHMECMAAEDDELPAESPVSTIRLLAEPLRHSGRSQSKILVQLIPTPRGDGKSAETIRVKPNGNLILNKATGEAEHSQPAASTIRLRQEPEVVSVPRVPVRCGSPPAASAVRVIVNR
jgi:hypothetical protein